MGSEGTKKSSQLFAYIKISIFSLVVSVLSACGGGDGTGSSVATTVSVSSVLSGLEVVPAVKSPGSGLATMTINDQTGELTGTLTLYALQGKATVAHIHSGAAGSNGGVLVTLEQDAVRPNVFTVPASTQLSAADRDSLLAGETYWQIHTNAHPSGELRAQILPDSVGIVRIATDMFGEEITNAVKTSGSGQGVLIINTSSGAIYGAMSTQQLQGAATLGHLHNGAPGIAGGIILTLEQDSADSNLFSVPANSILSAADLATVMAGNSYLQVHSSTQTTGEVRGQVLPADSPIQRLVVPLSGEEVVAAVNTEASGRAVLLVNSSTGDVTGAMTANNLQGVASAGHLHDGEPGSNGGILIDFVQDTVDTDIFTVPANTNLSSSNLARVLSSNSYIQIHSNVHTTGELRGQVLPQDSDIERITVPLSGEETFSGVNTAGTGQGVLLVDKNTGSLYGAMSTRNLSGNASAGHLHQGGAGANGGIIVTLQQDANDINLFTVPASTSLNATDLTEVLASRSYLQVHTSVHTTGEVRGQVLAKGNALVRVKAVLSGSEVVPAVTTSAGANAVLLVDTVTGQITGGLTASNAGGSNTAAHIHLGARDSNGAIAVVLTQDTADTNLFKVPDNTQLSGDDLNALLNTETYFQVHSTANPTGETRAQIVVPAAQ